MILGESGTGKELVARSIHINGPNAAKPFVPVDCGSLVPTLIESELFGHVKGAFTGADRAKEGLLASAEGGTVFLDEIGELPLDLQAKLLRALQEKEVRPVGATQARPISARVLAATNRDLAAMVEQGRFRKDLYFRLNVVNLRIPPLRDRRERYSLRWRCIFWSGWRRESGVARSFSDDALRVMAEYDWPGNVRELENAIERACALSSGPVLHMGDLPTQLQDFRMQQGADAAVLDVGRRDACAGWSERRRNGRTGGIVSIAEMEKHAILGTIRQLKGDKLMAAKLLGIGKTTLYRKLKEYGIADAGGFDELEVCYAWHIPTKESECHGCQRKQSRLQFVPMGLFGSKVQLRLVDVNGNEWDLTGKPAISCAAADVFEPPVLRRDSWSRELEVRCQPDTG